MALSSAFSSPNRYSSGPSKIVIVADPNHPAFAASSIAARSRAISWVNDARMPMMISLVSIARAAMRSPSRTAYGFLRRRKRSLNVPGSLGGVSRSRCACGRVGLDSPPFDAGWESRAAAPAEPCAGDPPRRSRRGHRAGARERAAARPLVGSQLSVGFAWDQEMLVFHVSARRGRAPRPCLPAGAPRIATKRPALPLGHVEVDRLVRLGTRVAERAQGDLVGARDESPRLEGARLDVDAGVVALGARRRLPPSSSARRRSGSSAYSWEVRGPRRSPRPRCQGAAGSPHFRLRSPRRPGYRGTRDPRRWPIPHKSPRRAHRS